jgi:hypothetical protein
MKIFICYPDLILALDSRARERTVRIRSLFFNRTRKIDRAVPVLKSYPAPTFVAALDLFLLTLFFVWLTGAWTGLQVQICYAQPPYFTCLLYLHPLLINF